MQLINVTTGAVVADKLIMKDGFFGRLRGLLGVKKLGTGEGIILKPCTQIHTFFMSMPIDAVFIDDDLKVLRVIENMRPWRVSPLLLKAVYVVESASGALKDALKEGDIITLRD